MVGTGRRASPSTSTAGSSSRPSAGAILYSVTQGDYYVWKNSTLGWEPTPTVAVTNLTDLTDVNAGAATNGQALVFNSGTSKWVPETLSLSIMSDVNVTEGSGIDGWVLAWKNADTKWEAKQLAAVAFSGSYSDLSGAAVHPDQRLLRHGEPRRRADHVARRTVRRSSGMRPTSKWENGARCGRLGRRAE